MEKTSFSTKKIIIIVLCVLLAAAIGAVAAVFLIKGMKNIPADASVYSYISEVIEPSEDIAGSEEVSVPEDNSPKLVITSPAKADTTTTSSVTVIRGSCDPAEKLFLNGSELACNPDGSFAYETSLKLGKNTFVFEHKGVKKTYTVTYRYVVINAYSPSKSTRFASGSTFGVTAHARPGSSVTATFNGKKITLVRGSTIDENSEFVEFSGSFTLPGDNIDDLNLGKVKFTGSYNGFTESFYSGNIVCLKNEALANVPYIAEIIAYTAETFDGNTVDDYSRPTNNYLPRGTVDYCDRSLIYRGSHTYAKLRCGRRVYTEKVDKPDLSGQKTAVIRRYQGTLPDHNEIGFTSFVDGGRHTTLTVDCMWKAPFFFDILPQGYANPARQDYTVSDTTFEYIDITFCYATVYRGSVEIPKNNQIFSRAEIRKSGGNTVLRLYLKKKGTFYGWDCYYNSNGQLCFDFLNPKNTVKAANKYGVSLKGTVILIDAGHGGVDSGAVGQGNVYESHRNLALANRIRAELTALGATVHMTRTSDVNITYDSRRKILKQLKPDYCISLHHDSSESPSARGFSVYYGQPHSFDAASFILNRTQSVGIYSKVQSFGWHYFFLTQMTACPSVIIENGFMTNYNDLQGIKSEAVNQKKAEAIVRGIADYFISIQYEEPLPEPEPEPEPEPSQPETPQEPSKPETGEENEEDPDNRENEE